MDQGGGSRRGNQSNIARPMSRLPMARASSISSAIHQDEPSKQSQLPRAATSSSRTAGIRPLGESNKTAIKPSFGWSGRSDGIISPTRTASPIKNDVALDTTPPSNKLDSAILEDGDGNENATTIDGKMHDFAKPEKRRPRPSLSERTMETLSQISPAPSPTRRRSSTVKSSGSMGPPAQPASAMRNSRPNTPSTPSSGRAPSPSKRRFRPPGKPASPAMERQIPPSLDTIYTPPRAFVRDHCSRIGRPARSDRRSISTAISGPKDSRPALKPANQAVKVKSMYDLRAAASRTLNSKPSLPTLATDPATPAKGLVRKPSHQDVSPQASLMKARHPGENVLASATKVAAPASKVQPPAKRTARTVPMPDQQHKRQPSTSYSASTKSSSTLRDTIAKAKAARKEELRKSGMQADSVDQQWTEKGAPVSEPGIRMDSQSLKKKIQGAVTTGVLNLSAMSLQELPNEVLTMYDYKEDAVIAWSEAVDLKKLIVADNEIEMLPDTAFPDWTEEEMLADTEKSNQFGGLDVLDVHGNLLSTVPIGFRRLHQLRTLNLSNNSLDLSVFSTISELTALRELRLARNGLSGALPLQICRMVALQILDLSDNQLDEIPASVVELKSLQKLMLNGNRLGSIPLNSLPIESLLELDVSKNMLSGTFASGGELNAFQNLQSLTLSFNSLDSVCSDTINLPALQTLAVHNNRIAVLPDLSNCPRLTVLTASENSLTAIPGSFYGLTCLRNVDFSGNNIRTIEASIMDMPDLTGFNIASNPLREKKYLTMNIDEIRTDFARKAGPVEGGKVQSIDVGWAASQGMVLEQGNSTEVQLHKPKGGLLDLSSRGLSTLDPSQVDLTASVHTIRLANNDFTAFPVELLMHPSIRWSLKSLDMSHNPLLHPVDYLTSELHLPLLKSLYIVSTGLTTLDTLTTNLKAPELLELNISCHRMTGHVPWVRAWYPSVTTLLASDNWFDSIDVEAVRGLEVLDIRNNEVEGLPAGIGLLGNHAGKNEAGRLRSFECSGNKFRVPRLVVLERGTEATLRDLRRTIPLEDVPEEWQGEV